MTKLGAQRVARIMDHLINLVMDNVEDENWDGVEYLWYKGERLSLIEYARTVFPDYERLVEYGYSPTCGYYE